MLEITNIYQKAQPHFKEYLVLKMFNLIDGENSLERIKYYIEKLGVPINVDKTYTSSLLIMSINRKHFETAKYLIKKGFNVNFIDQDGDTALLQAVEKENIELVKILINKGANIYKRNKNDFNSVAPAFKYNFADIGFYLKKRAYDDKMIKKTYTTKKNKGKSDVRQSALNTDICNICTTEYQEGQPVVMLHGNKKQDHNMCVDCFSRLNSVSCPFCRQKVTVKKTKFGDSVYIVKYK